MTGRRPWSVFLGAFWPFLLGSVLIAGGIAAIVVGYLGVSGTVFVGLQIPYLVSGVALGLALVFIGTVLLVVQVMTRQTRLLRRMLAELEAARTTATPSTNGHTSESRSNGHATGAAAGTDGDPSPQRRETGRSNASVFVVRGGRWFHRSGCMLLEGKRSTTLDAQQAEDQGLAPCRLCDPIVPVGR